MNLVARTEVVPTTFTFLFQYEVASALITFLLFIPNCDGTGIEWPESISESIWKSGLAIQLEGGMLRGL